jgi:hypothetical protein
MNTKDFSMLGETVITANGKKDFAYVDGTNSIVAQIENVIKTNKGENSGDMHFGSDLFTFFYDASISQTYICKTLESSIKYSMRKLFNVSVILLERKQNYLKFQINFSTELDINSHNKNSCIIQISAP